MKQHTFAAGTKVFIDGVPARLLKKISDSDWQIEDELTCRLREESHAKLLRLWEEERLIFAIDDVSLPGASHPRPAVPIASMSEKDQARTDFKIHFVTEMKKRRFSGWHSPCEVDGVMTSPFKIALKEVSADLGRLRPVSRGSYYEWVGILDAGDASELRSRYGRGRSQIDLRVRGIILSIMQTCIDEAEQLRGVKPLAPKDIFQRINTEIKIQNAEIRKRNNYASLQGRPRELMLRKPKADSTYYEYWRKFNAEDRLLVQKGPSATREAFRGGRGTPRPTECLDRLEYDETKLRFFCYDEYLGIALGRPWLSWYFDVATELIVGIYLGFEQVSDLAIMSALKSACLPKAFLSEEYIGVGEYPVYGIGRSLIFDNPFSQHGNTILAATNDLRSSHKFAPSRVSWFKPYVESSFHTLNSEFLYALPGFAMNGVRTKDYDPTKNGCIGFRALLLLIWKWIADVHAVDGHSKLKVPRIDVWRESASRTPPALLSSKVQLDVLFTVVRQGKIERSLDHRGVFFEGLRYYSLELHEFRRLFGSNTRVRIRMNPANLEYILIELPQGSQWIRVQAVDVAYARNRSLLQHQLCRQAGRQLFNEDNLEAWERAQDELSALIQDSVLIASSISINSLAAKAWGLGTQHLTDALDHGGRLGPMGGPFHGHTLAPPMTVLNALARPTTSPQPSPTLLLPSDGQGSLPLPKFVADLSLSSPR